MLSDEAIKALAVREQTTEENILREYAQHLFLSELYREKGSERLLFKGGTALRIVHQSPRFSEDLDFTGVGIRPPEIDRLIRTALRSVVRHGCGVEMGKAGPTSGGYLAELTFLIRERRVGILLEVSLRSRTRSAGEPVLVSGDFLPPYTILTLPTDDLVREKIQAALTRKKPRDFFDIYFILRHNLLPVQERGKLNKTLALLGQSRFMFRRELKAFLPRRFHSLLRDFPKILQQEIRRFVS